MPGANHGLERGLGMIAETAILAIFIGKVVPTLVDAGLLPRGLFWWVIPASIFTAVMTIDASQYWSFGYLAGVSIGIFIALPILIETGLLGFFDLLIYGGIAVGSILLKASIHSSSF